MNSQTSSRAPAPVQPVVEDTRALRGLLMMTAGGLILGTLGVFLEESGAHPLTAVFFRCVFGALFLLVYALATGRLGEFRLPRDGVAAVLATGALMVLNWALFFAAIQLTSIALATVVFHVQPLWVMVLGVVLLREPSVATRWLAGLVALGGLALATGLIDQAPGTFDRRFALGVGCALAGSLCYAVVTLVAKTQSRISPLALSWWQCVVGSVLLAWWPWVHGWPAFDHTLLWLIGLGAIHTAGAYVLLYGGMRRLSASRIAVLQFIYPVAAILCDLWVYDRGLSATQWIGVVLMGSAIWAAGMRSQRGWQRTGS